MSIRFEIEYRSAKNDGSYVKRGSVEMVGEASMANDLGALFAAADYINTARKVTETGIRLTYAGNGLPNSGFTLTWERK